MANALFWRMEIVPKIITRAGLFGLQICIELRWILESNFLDISVTKQLISLGISVKGFPRQL